MQKADITDIEQYVIDKVKEMRKAKSMSQQELANLADLSAGFIAHVESPTRRAKYNLNHLNTFAKLFNCSPQDFLPKKFL